MKNRNVLYKGEKILLNKLGQKYKGKYSLNFEGKNGRKANCKISMVPVSLPEHPDTTLNLVICILLFANA